MSTPRAPRPSTLRAGVVVAVLATALTVLVGTRAGWTDDGPRATPAPASAATGPAPVSLDMTGYDPAHLIDDDVLHDATTMDEAAVTAFIARVNDGCVPGASGTPCLAQATFDTEDIAPTTACPLGYAGATGEGAAAVISQVATSCDVNPQVLLTLLQKEQGLLTASGTSLTARDYEAATGYACPDGAECDPAWAGFQRQVYGAASQLQRYRLNPGAYAVVAGQPTELAYSPDTSCGTGTLTAANQATAGLYDYTPYLVNDAAAHGGNDCTSWGNWTFYGYFRAWFGDPTPSTP